MGKKPNILVIEVLTNIHNIDNNLTELTDFFKEGDHETVSYMLQDLIGDNLNNYDLNADSLKMLYQRMKNNEVSRWVCSILSKSGIVLISNNEKIKSEKRNELLKLLNLIE